MNNGQTSPRLQKPDVDDSIDAFLSEDESIALAAPEVQAAQDGSRSATLSWSGSIDAALAGWRSVVPIRARELSGRALLVAAGLGMIVAAGVLVFEQPRRSPELVSPGPIVSAIPSTPRPESAGSSVANAPVVALPAAPPVETTSVRNPSVANTLPPANPEPRSTAPAIEGRAASPLPESAAATAAPVEPFARDENDEDEPVSVVANASPLVSRPELGAVVDPVSRDKAAIGGVLNAYQQSYNALDAETVSTIWQGLDVRALRRAFSTLSSQDLSFDRCDVKVLSERAAQAACTGVLNYVPKVGAGDQQQRRLSWTIDLRRTGDRWLIANVDAR